jgi:hypothetical protein
VYKHLKNQFDNITGIAANNRVALGADLLIITKKYVQIQKSLTKVFTILKAPFYFDE